METTWEIIDHFLMYFIMVMVDKNYYIRNNFLLIYKIETLYQKIQLNKLESDNFWKKSDFCDEKSR
jgi:hypothetical protein